MASNYPWMRRVVDVEKDGDQRFLVLDCGHRVPAPKSTTTKPFIMMHHVSCPECKASPRKRRKNRVCRVCGCKLCSHNRGTLCYAHQGRGYHGT